MGGLAWVSVADEGPGIDPRDHEHVFHRGWSANDASIGGEARSGLGLAITRQVVEAHGGMVTLRSTLGEGAEFVLWIPATSSADPKAVTGDGVHHLASPA
jgi:signal transduction histidine kinase